MNLILFDHQYPIRPEHIDLDMLDGYIREIVSRCQSQRSWSPFRLKDVSATSFQLRNTSGLVQIKEKFFITHEFVVMIFQVSSIETRDKTRVLIGEAQDAVVELLNWSLYTMIPDIVTSLVWLLIGSVLSLLFSKTVFDGILMLGGWPIFYPYMSLVWVALIVVISVIAFRSLSAICICSEKEWTRGS